MQDWPKTYDGFVEKREAAIRSDKWTPRVLLAGYWWERGEPLTDEVLATQEYIRRKGAGLIHVDERGIPATQDGAGQ